MHKVLREYLHRFVLVYIDDILLIYSEPGLPPRCEGPSTSAAAPPLPGSVQILGFHIESSGIRMDEGKVEAIKTWPQPTNIKELQRFLGFSNFYRRFIQNYSTLTNPLTNLLCNKPKSSVLLHSRQGSFREVKDVFHTSSHPRSSGSRKTLHC